MDFSFSEEQELIRDSIRRFVQNDYDFDKRRQIINQEQGFSSENWQTFAELGWLGLPLPENHGGFGGTPVDTMIVMQEFGKGLVVEPYLTTVILAAGLISAVANEAQQAQLLPDIAEGKLQLAFAHTEPQARFDLANVKTSATQDGNDYILNGHKAVVFNGPVADKFLVSARTGGEQRDQQGISLFLVDADADGVERRNYPTVDALRAAEVTLSDVRVAASAVLGDINQAYAAIEHVIDQTIVALAAEAVGIMEVLVQSTVEYCKTREQFGTAIGNFQVLQHRMVDMLMEAEQCKSLLYMAVLKLDGPENECKKAVSALKQRVGSGGRFVGQQAIQLHGGMGMTDEMSVSHYFKRLTMIDKTFGNADYHFKRFMSL